MKPKTPASGARSPSSSFQTKRNADAEAVQRFLREARVVSTLNHPHICTLHDLGSTQSNRHFMVMELLDGQSLKDRMRAIRAQRRRGPRVRRADRRCARCRARAGHRPSRHQAGEPVRDAARHHQGARLRRRETEPGARRRHRRHAGALRSADDDGHHHRHGVVHVAGAGARPGDRRAQRPVLRRRRVVRDGHRPAAVPGRNGGDDLRGVIDEAAAAALARSRPACPRISIGSSSRPSRKIARRVTRARRNCARISSG